MATSKKKKKLADLIRTWLEKRKKKKILEMSKKIGRNTDVLEIEMEPLTRRRNGTNTDAEYGVEEESPTITGGMTNYQRKISFSMLALALLVGLFLFQIDQTVEEDTFGVDELGHSEFDHVIQKPAKEFHTTSGSFGSVRRATGDHGNR